MAEGVTTAGALVTLRDEFIPMAKYLRIVEAGPCPRGAVPVLELRKRLEGQGWVLVGSYNSLLRVGELQGNEA